MLPKYSDSRVTADLSNTIHMKSSKSKADHTAGGAPEILGIVMIVDMTGFSNRPTNDQEKLVDKLWQAVHSRPMLKSVPLLTNCTGDGGLFAWIDRAEPLEALEFGKYLMDSMGSSNTSESSGVSGSHLTCGLRVALHHGRFAGMKPPTFSQVQAIGSAPNQCARLVAFSDGASIIVSEEFVKYCVETSGDTKFLGKFSPALTDDPISIFVKHNVEQHIRIFYGDANPATIVTPKKLLSLQHVEHRIKAEMLEALDVTFFLLAEQDVRVTPKSCQARISLFVKDHRQKVLNPTRYRYCQFPGAGSAAGRTRYSVQGEGVGCVGISYCREKSVGINGLPDFNRKPSEYCAALESELHIPRKDVENFQRHSRTFGAFPIQFNHGSIDAVVCIDMLDPLKSLTRHKWENEVLEILRVNFSDKIAQLLRLRA